MLVRIALRLHSADEIARRRRCLDVPDPVEGWAMVDTGASRTLIDARAVRALRLPHIGRRSLRTIADRQRSRHGIYRTRIDWLEQLLAPCNVDEAVECRLEKVSSPTGERQLVALIGRDVLQLFIMLHDGPRGTSDLLPGDAFDRLPAAAARSRRRR